MNWYKTGTISVANGNSAITGSGTAWVANAAAGEAVYCPDGRFYEIQSVNSDTSITIAGNYSGATLSGQSYTILPSQSFIRDLAAQAAELINSYASIANAAGAGKFGDGTLGAPGISFVNDTNTGIRRTADGTFRLVSNGVDIAEIGPGGITVFSGKYSGARYDIDGWHFVGYNGNELRLGNWESGGEWTEFSTYIHGTKRTSVTSAGLTVIGALGVSGAATLSAGASLPLPSIGGSTAIEFPYYGDANAKTRIVAASTSDHRQTLKIQQNTAQSDAAPVDVVTLDASGNLLVNTASVSGRLSVQNVTGVDQKVFYFGNDASFAGVTGGQIHYSTTPNDTGHEFLYCDDASNCRASIRSNGGLANYSANNVNLSDARLKKDFKPAKSYYDNWEQIDFITYLYKDQTDGELNLGVTAQQLESVFPELIDNSGFGDAPEGEAPYKAVYQTDFQYATAKALQEAIAKINTLESRLAALEGA